MLTPIQNSRIIIPATLAILACGAAILAACAAPPAPPTVPVVATAAPPTQSVPTPQPPTVLPTTPSQPSTAPVVKIQSGELEGVQENGLFVFKGIPYAAPPVGELRWQAPQPSAAWEGVRKADAFSDACVQPESSSYEEAGGIGPTSEDCLYLNVWTPNPDPSAKLPVMVWIHGGALVIGSGSRPLYDGAPLAERGAVVVTLNYRLGPLGFFSHPALDKEYPDGPVNFGLLDEIAALKWVKANITAFGGDSDNVMIFGESAGGQSVLALFASPLARGLFHKGVAQSAYGIPSHPRAQAQQTSIRVVEALGLPGADATLEELRAVPAESFGELRDKQLTLAPSFIFGDAAMPEPILNVFQKGKQAAVPLIIGSNSDEATVAEAFGIDPASLIKELGAASIALKPLYPGVTDDSQLGSELIRDLIFTAFARRISDLHSRLAPSWRYYFSYVPVNRRAREPGVPHGGEIVFVMDTGSYAAPYKEILTDADREMARRVSSYWFEFARSGKPDPAGEPEWLQNDTTHDQTLEFGETIAMQENLMRGRLQVFTGLLNILGRLLRR